MACRHPVFRNVLSRSRLRGSSTRRSNLSWARHLVDSNTFLRTSKRIPEIGTPEELNKNQRDGNTEGVAGQIGWEDDEVELGLVAWL